MGHSASEHCVANPASRRSLRFRSWFPSKRSVDCGRFVAKKRWTPLLAEQRKDPNARIAFPICDGCASEYDPPEW